MRTLQIATYHPALEYLKMSYDKLYYIYQHKKDYYIIKHLKIGNYSHIYMNHLH